MILKFKLSLITVLVLVIFSACNGGSKNDYSKVNKSSGTYKEHSVSPNTKPKQPLNSEIHTVVINDILTTSKYVYLHVNEGNEQFWIATRKQEINKGGTYFYKGGLLKTNFESKEHKRVFEKIYLVTSLVQSSHGNETINMDKSKLETQEFKQKNKEISTSKIESKQKGSIKISELVENHKKYEGKTVQISGKCIKINPNIMGRNWIHIKDGSKDDYDLVITSDIFIKEGSMVTLKATVVLNKDFGAGYKYDLILEDGIIVP